ncbi:MAG: hypothetical protein HYS55_06000 [Candidatus Omnitrophica bacterium]|nr:hypothetical protein [Candidatus Omnitrophota bacterium]
MNPLEHFHLPPKPLRPRKEMNGGLSGLRSVNACFAIPIAKRRHSTFLRQRKCSREKQRCFGLCRRTLRKPSRHGVPKGRARLSARVRHASFAAKRTNPSSGGLGHAER